MYFRLLMQTGDLDAETTQKYIDAALAGVGQKAYRSGSPAGKGTGNTGGAYAGSSSCLPGRSCLTGLLASPETAVSGPCDVRLIPFLWKKRYETSSMRSISSRCRKEW